MSVVSDFFDAVNANSRTKTYTGISSVQQVKDAIADFGGKSTNNYKQLTKQRIITSEGGNPEPQLTASSASVGFMAPVALAAAGAADGTLSLTLSSGTVLSSAGATLKAALASVPLPQLVEGVAALSGLYIGWKGGEAFCEWLRENQDLFEFEEGDLKSEVLTYMVETQQGIKCFVSEGFIDNMTKALRRYGFFEEHETAIPIDPIIGSHSYAFAQRFPAIPDKYVPACQKIVDTFNVDIWNKYIIVFIGANGGIGLNVLSSNYIDLVSRNASLINNKAIVHQGDVVLQISDPGLSPALKITKYSYQTNGEVELSEERTVPTYGRLDISPSTQDGVCYDNFGDKFHVIDQTNHKIGGLYDVLTDAQLDPNAVDITQPGVLETDFPDYYNSRVKVSSPTLDDWLDDAADGTLVNEGTDYFPVEVPIPYTPPYTGTQAGSLANPITPDVVIEKAIANWPDISTDSPAAVDPAPTGTEPPTILPVIPEIPAIESTSGTNMVSLYNPTKSQLSSFASWLWSFDPTTTFKKLFNDPMQAIIGLHMIYITPHTAGTNANIIVGGVDSGVSSKLVNNQYKLLNCGELTIQPYFNNVHDYISTRIQLFLPFIGFVPLNTQEVMNHTIKVFYYVDVMTGTCLATVQVKQKASDGFYDAYTYSGNCAVQFPITGANYSSILGNIIGVAGGIAATVASEGALAPVLFGAGANAVANSKVQVQRGGGIGANAGAMGQKKPFLIITRDVPYEAQNRGRFEGMPQQLTAVLKSQKGYTRVKNINLEGIACTEEEKSMILSKLQGGVII